MKHWKSSKTFYFFSLIPAECHSSPYSFPPLRFAIAIFTPIFYNKANLNALNGQTRSKASKHKLTKYRKIKSTLSNMLMNL